jgi:prevent-host-death family protein
VREVDIRDARSQFSTLINRVRAGQEIVITDAGTPVAKLVSIAAPKAARVLGADRGKISIAADAFDPLTPEQLSDWDGSLLPRSRLTRRRRPRRTRRASRR